MMYNKRGYTTDGQEIVYTNIEVQPAEQMIVGDDLTIYLTKELHNEL